MVEMSNLSMKNFKSTLMFCAESSAATAKECRSSLSPVSHSLSSSKCL